MEITTKETAELVRNQRAETGLSMDNFAKAIGVSYGTINHLEHGKSLPTTDTMARLARYAGKCGAVHFAECWSLLLNADWLGSVVVMSDLIRRQVGLMQAQIKQAMALLEAGKHTPAMALLNHAVERADQTLKDAAGILPSLRYADARRINVRVRHWRPRLPTYRARVAQTGPE
jgi:DNA-binding XRE family transcriptional regulator